MRTVVDQAADIGEVLLTEDQIQAQGRRARAPDQHDMAGRQLTLVSVLKGSLPFMADLMRAISLPLRIDLMEVSSYGGATTESSGLVRILKDLSSSIEGEDVLIVEDIIDTGPDAELPRPLPARQEARRRCGSARCSTSRPAASSRSRSTTPGSRSRTSSWSATASTTASCTGTCASWASCGPRSTARGEPGGRRMTMHRRPVGRSRLLAAIGALVALAGCFLPWWTVGGGERPAALERHRVRGHRASSSSRPRSRRSPS